MLSCIGMRCTYILYIVFISVVGIYVEFTLCIPLVLLLSYTNSNTRCLQRYPSQAIYIQLTAHPTVPPCLLSSAPFPLWTGAQDTGCRTAAQAAGKKP